MKDNFTQGQENSNNPFIVKYPYDRHSEDEVSDSCLDEWIPE